MQPLTVHKPAIFAPSATPALFIAPAQFSAGMIQRLQERAMAELVPVHLLPDSERLLKTHSAWQASWDASDQQEEPDIETLTEEAFNLYADGLLPIQIKRILLNRHSSVPARTLARAQRAAERQLQAAETAPPELRRAMVAVARQRAIQGALAAGEWGVALRGLERAGEIAGELRESAGLGEEDLVLTVSIEAPLAPLAPLPEGDSQPVSGETDGESHA